MRKKLLALNAGQPLPAIGRLQVYRGTDTKRPASDINIALEGCQGNLVMKCIQIYGAR